MTVSRGSAMPCWNARSMGWNRRVRFLALMLAWLVVSNIMLERPVWAQIRGAGEEAANEATRKTADENAAKAGDPRDAADAKPADAPLVYVPPARGRARHTVGAATRTQARGGPRVVALNPRDHVGWTSKARPRLYWYLSEPTQERVTLTVFDDEAIEPLVEVNLDGPVNAGVHALDLEALGADLEPGRVYRWFVMVVVHGADQAAMNQTAEGAIERVDVGREGTRGDARARARAGYWYDALEKIQEAINANTADPAPRADLEALLTQGNVELNPP